MNKNQQSPVRQEKLMKVQVKLVINLFSKYDDADSNLRKRRLHSKN